MDEKIRKHADALYDRAFHNLMAARGEKLRSVFSQLHKSRMDVGTSGIAFDHIRKVHVEFVGDDMSARVTSFQQAFEYSNAVPTAEDFAEIWSAVNEVYQRGLRSVAVSLRRNRQQGRVGIAKVDEDSGDVAHQHGRVLRDFNVWRSQMELHAFVPTSADEQASREDKLVKFLGGEEPSTETIVFTDIVDSTSLFRESGDSASKEIWQQHLAHLKGLLLQHSGLFINEFGDGILALFHNAVKAIEFAMALNGDSGHPRVRVRIGIHVGLVSRVGATVCGQEVSFTQRVMTDAIEGGITVSRQVKEDFEKLGKMGLPNLRWVERESVELKGFDQPATLWRIEVVS